MLNFIKNKLLSLCIFIIFITVLLSANHRPFVSLNGSIISASLLLLFYIFHKLQFHHFSFVSFHLIAIILSIVYPLPEIAILALLSILLREFILLAKERGENNSRTSLLWDLGAIKPDRQISFVLYHTFPFVLTSLLIAFASLIFSFPAIVLAYFPLFIFAMSFGNLLVEETSKAATEKR